MAFPRHASRSVHEAMVTRVTEGLASLLWTVVDEVPFGGDVIVVKPVRPFVGDRLDGTIAPATVTISLGTEHASSNEEVGGGLASQEYPFFLDVFMETTAEATALTCDLRDLLMGRVSGYGRFLSLVDMITDEDVTDWSLEINDVERVSPDHAFPLEWQSVHATVTAFFPEVIP